MFETLLLFDSMCTPSIEVLRRNWGRNGLRKLKIRLHFVAEDGNERNLPRWLMTDLSIFISSYSSQISWIEVNTYRGNRKWWTKWIKEAERTFCIVTIKISVVGGSKIYLWNFDLEIYVDGLRGTSCALIYSRILSSYFTFCTIN